MTAARALQEEFAKIGYAAIACDYVFSDVFSSSAPNRKVAVAAFTHTPHSYRNAALAVVDGQQRPATELVSEYRALGAPLLFVIDGNEVVVWQVRSGAIPQEIARSNVSQLNSLFSRYREAWSPISIQRAKSLGQFDPHYQLSFVDLGLLPAIEAEIHSKLDHLLERALAQAVDPQTGRSRRVNERALFRALFRFLAAKVLQDRSHSLSSAWDANKIETVIDQITRYYGLPGLSVRPGTVEYRVFSSIWECIGGGINFQNISADDLAFVYEDTLVTEDIRKAFGTHSTPRQVAEYIVSRLGFHEYANAPDQLRVYEPFAGAAVLLISALRHLRELLPVNWTDQQRHEFLIKHMSGDEFDAFACEVAMLSLILADYPNHNGWQIGETNLFKDGVLDARMRKHTVVVCNPPFEAFSAEDRAQFSIARSANTKAMAVLNAALDAHPLALGFVLPRAFILDRQFIDQRRRLEKLYGDIELVEAPDRIFRYSQVEFSLLIAREPRPPSALLTNLRSTEIADRDGQKFLQTGKVTRTRAIVRATADEPDGNLWIPRLASLWTYLESYPHLANFLRPTWGLQWKYNQTEAFSPHHRPGFRRGLSSARNLRQFKLNPTQWLDYRQEFVRRAYGQDWRHPKILVNEGRLSRGAWRIGAALDTQGLLYSQQFFGLWPRTGSISEKDLLAFVAILNGPIANAFIAIHSPAKGIRATAVGSIPIPHNLPSRVSDLVSEYVSQLNDNQIMKDNEAQLAHLLTHIDAAVLEAYNLPPRIERELLEFFRDEERPVAHPWQHWLPENFKPFIPLHELVSDQFQKATQSWTQEVFKPLPAEEVEALRKYMD